MNNIFEKSYLFMKNQYRLLRSSYWSYQAKKLGKYPSAPEKDIPHILLLLPEAGISLYVKSMVILADQFTRLGYKITFARCFNIFERCIFMDSESLPLNATTKDKKQLCTYCFRSFQKNVIPAFDFVDLRHFIDQGDHKEINEIIQNNPKEPFEFIYEGINFSGILEYNMFLYLKKSDISDLKPGELKYWQQYLKSLFIGYKAVEKLVRTLKITNIIMSDEYSLNAVVKDMSGNLNVKAVNYTFPFHKDIDTTKVRIMQNDSLSENCLAIKNWNHFKSLSIPAKELKEAIDDLIVKMSKKGTYSYSPSKSSSHELRNVLGLSKERKTIVAYPSSPDEVEALLNANRKRGLPLEPLEDAFTDQFDWLDTLINFVEGSNEYQLVLRLHPRLAPNHREKWGCLEYDTFVSKYKKEYQNVRIIWPEASISSYDLADIADVVTIAWSSMGNFMARLGIPVISGLKLSLPLPNDDFHVFANTKEEYFQKIGELSIRTPNLSILKNTYRFYCMYYLGYCVDLGDVINDDLIYTKKTSENAPLLKMGFVESKNVLNINLMNLKEIQTDKLVLEETNALQKQIYRLIHFFMTNHDTFNEENIDIINDIATITDLHTSKGAKLIRNKDNFDYFYCDVKYSKYSLVVSRLATLAENF